MNDEERLFLREGEELGMNYFFSPFFRHVRGGLGNVLGRGSGDSLEFEEHRDYQMGDDLRKIDWSVFARNDKLVVKVHRKEIRPHVDILLDTSRSMALPGTSKKRAALALVALLTVAARNSDLATHLWLTTNEGIRPLIGGDGPPSTWLGIEFEQRLSPFEALERAFPQWPPDGFRIFISDLLYLGQPEHFLRYLAHHSSQMLLIHLVAQKDIEPPDVGSYRFIDSETGEYQEIAIDEEIRQNYYRTLSQHWEAWRAACRQMGAQMFTLIAEEFVEHWSLDELFKMEILRIK